MKQKIILVVCRGNIARSPVAEAIINTELKKRNLDGQLLAISRGTQGTRLDPTPVKHFNISQYPDLYLEAKPALDELEVDLSRHVSIVITENDVTNSSIILAVDLKTKNTILELFPKSKDKTYLLTELVNDGYDFDDPENLSGTEKHSKVFKGIKNVIIEGFPRLIELMK